MSRIADSTSPHWQPSDTQAEDAPAPPSQSHRNVLVPSPRCAGDAVQAPELADLHPRRTVRCSHSRQGPHTQHSKSPDPALTNFLHRLMLDPPSPTSQGLALTFKCAFLPRGKCSEPSLAWSQVHFTTPHTGMSGGASCSSPPCLYLRQLPEAGDKNEITVPGQQHRVRCRFTSSVLEAYVQLSGFSEERLMNNFYKMETAH